MTTEPTHSIVPLAEEQPVLPLWPDTARILGVGRSQVYKCATAGSIPVIRLGGRLVVPTAALRRMLQLDG